MFLKCSKILLLNGFCFRLNYAILVSLVLLEKRDLENLLLAPQPTWHQKCCATKATTGLWTCGAQGSLFMCLFLVRNYKFVLLLINYLLRNISF